MNKMAQITPMAIYTRTFLDQNCCSLTDTSSEYRGTADLFLLTVKGGLVVVVVVVVVVGGS